MSLTNSDLKPSLEGEEKKNRKLLISGFGDGILAAENENRLLEDLAQADFAVYLKDFSYR